MPTHVHRWLSASRSALTSPVLTTHDADDERCSSIGYTREEQCKCGEDFRETEE